MTKLNAHQVRVLAVASYTDPKTCRKFLAGREVTSTCRERIKKALREIFPTESQPADANRAAP